MHRPLIVLSLLLIAAAACAGPLFTITPVTPGAEKWYEGAESFENSMPPSGWFQTSAAPSSQWKLWSLSPYDGAYCAYSEMDIMGGAIDEVLGFHAGYTANQKLHFALKGQMATSATLLVRVGGDVVFDFGSDWTLPWDQWGVVEIDLSQTNHAGEADVIFSWQYVGTFAPGLYLDWVGITEESVSEDVASWGALKRVYGAER